MARPWASTKPRYHCHLGPRIQIRGAVDQHVLIGFVPAEDRLGSLILAPVFMRRSDMVPPWLNPAREACGRPETYLGPRHRGQPEDGRTELILRRRFRNKLVPTCEFVKPLAGFGVLLETIDSVAALPGAICAVAGVTLNRGLSVATLDNVGGAVP